MSVVIGIDVGGSTTKIVGFENTDGRKRLIEPLTVRATDPVTSVYGAFGSFITGNDLTLSDIERIAITGVGSTHIEKPIYSLGCEKVDEFSSIGKGGLYLSGLDKAIVVSLGTGTALVYAEAGKKTKYLGGTGVGGGTVLGLSKLILGMDNITHIQNMAADGDISKIDLRVSDISKDGLFPDMSKEMTAANFGNVSDIASKNDLALGIFNIVFETIAMVSLFAARSYNIKDIILTGNLTTVDMCEKEFAGLGKMFGVNYIIPKNAQYATVIGSALL